jgi:hypothetical protein
MEGKGEKNQYVLKLTLDMMWSRASLMRPTLRLMQPHVEAMKLTKGSTQTTTGPMQNELNQDM